MRKVMMMTIEEAEKLPKLTNPHPPVVGKHYKYVNTEGKVFVVTKLLLSEFIEMLPIVLES